MEGHGGAWKGMDILTTDLFIFTWHGEAVELVAGGEGEKGIRGFPLSQPSLSLDWGWTGWYGMDWTGLVWNSLGVFHFRTTHPFTNIPYITEYSAEAGLKMLL
jgi:hypothetical protein